MSENGQENGQGKALVVVEDVSGTALEAYGQLEQVAHLVDRLMMLHGAAPEVGRAGMRAVASLAIMVGANPLPGVGEIHVWQSKGKTQIDLGIFFYRRRADELGGVFWFIKPRLMDDEERAANQIADNELAGICQACRKADLLDFISRGFTKDEIREGLAVYGIGSVPQGATPKAGRPLSWTATKNAEKDLYRRLYSNWQRIPQGGQIPQILQDLDKPLVTALPQIPAEVAEAGPDAVDRYYQLISGSQQAKAMSPDERQAKAAENSQLLYGDPSFQGFGDEPRVVHIGARDEAQGGQPGPRIVEGSARLKMPTGQAQAQAGEGLAQELKQALEIANQMAQALTDRIELVGAIRAASGIWDEDGTRDEEKAQPPEQKAVQRLAAIMGKALGAQGSTDEAGRGRVLMALFGKESTKALAASEVEACLDRWALNPLAYEPNGLGLVEIPSLLGEVEAQDEDEGQQATLF